MIEKIGEYHIWAGNVIRHPIKQLTEREFSRSFGNQSVKSIAQHIVLALETCFFIAHKSNDERVFEEALKASKDELCARWSQLDQQLMHALVKNPIGHITVPHIRKEPFDIPATDFYLQYVMHTIHHRGQLATLLRKLGQDVPGTDYLMFLASLQD
jgi:uncharacterized damage-inducible protein DinB